MMRKISFIFLITATLVAFSSCLEKINVKNNDASVSIVMSLEKNVEIEDDTSFSGTVYTLILRNCQSNFSMVPVQSGPLDFVAVYSLNSDSFVSFHTIIPSKPVVVSKGKEITVTFLKSRNRYDYSFNENMTFGDVVKYLSESLKINISISSGVSGMKIPSLTLNNSPPEDALRTLIISMNLSYTYLPNGTMYIARNPEEIKQKLLKFWGADSEEAILQDIREGLLKSLSNKSMLVTTGTPEDIKRIFQALAEKQEEKESYKILDVSDKQTAASMLNEIFGSKLKIFTKLPGKSIMIYGAKLDITSAEKALTESGLMLPSAGAKGRLPVYRVLDVQDVQAAKKVIGSIFPNLKAIEVSSNKLILYGPEVVIESAKKLLLNVGMLGYIKASEKEQVRYEIMKVPNPGDVVQALSVIFGDNLRIALVGDELILVGPEQTINDAKEAIKKFSVETKEKEVTEIITVPDPMGVAEILGQLFEDLKIIPGKIGLVVKGKKERIDEAKEFLKKFEKLNVQKAEEMRIVSVANSASAANVLSKVFENLKIVPVSGKQIVLVGTKDEIDSAIALLKKVFTSTGEEENLVMKIMELPGVSQEQLNTAKKIEEYVKDVEVFRVAGSDKIVLFGKKEESVDKAMKMIKEILSGVSRPVSVKDGKITVKSDNLPLGEIVKEVLEDLGKSVVAIDKLSTPVSLYLENVSFDEFLDVVRKLGAQVDEEGKIFYIRELREKNSLSKLKETKPSTEITSTSAKPTASLKKPEKLQVELKGERVNLRSNGATLAEIISRVADKLSENVVFVDSPDIPVTLNLTDIDLEDLSDILRNFGYELEKVGDVYYVKKTVEKFTSESTSSNMMFDVRFKGEKANINVENAPLSQLIKKLSEGFKKSIVFVDVPSERITLNVQSLNLSDMRDLLERFGYNLEEIDGIYYLTKMGKSIVAKIAYGFGKLQELVQSMGGKIFYDDTTGVVIVRNLNSIAYGIVKNFISILEKSPPQVSIEVRIVEEQANENSGSSAGVNISSGSGDVEINNSGIRLKTKILSASDYESYLKGLLGGDVSLGITGKSEKSKSKVLASPSVTTMNGEKAVIEIGGEKTFITPDGTRLTYPIGVRLEITPYVRSDGKIDLLVNVSISEVEGSYPVITQNRRAATTRVVLEDGQTLVIGGLTRETEAKTVEKLPILGDLPIIGWLFRTESITQETRNLDIFITAKVVGKR